MCCQQNTPWGPWGGNRDGNHASMHHHFTIMFMTFGQSFIHYSTLIFVCPSHCQINSVLNVSIVGSWVHGSMPCNAFIRNQESTTDHYILESWPINSSRYACHHITHVLLFLFLHSLIEFTCDEPIPSVLDTCGACDVV